MMDEEIHTTIDTLIRDYYRWGEGGFLAIEQRSQDIKVNRRSVSLWIERETRPFRATALSLIAMINPILKDLENGLSPKEKRRFFARIDHLSLVKSPDSILEKMVREWDPGKGSPLLTFDTFRSELQDLGRFRIVTSFLSDMDCVKGALEAPFGSSTRSQTIPQSKLGTTFHLRGNHFEDHVCLQPAKRTKGERCYKGVFYPRETTLNIYKVEVQVQTQLQEAWDKKDHFLNYEPRRRGENIDPSSTIEMFSMSELLYVADLTFDRLKKTIVGEKDNQRG